MEESHQPYDIRVIDGEIMIWVDGNWEPYPELPDEGYRPPNAVHRDDD